MRCFAWRARKKCDRGVGWNTYRRACRHACRSRRGPRRHHRPRGGYARAGGRTRASRCEGERGESCVSARLRQRPRGRGKKRGASPPPDAAAATCRTRGIARAHERFPTSRRGHAPRGGRGGTAAAAAASAAAPRGGRGEVAGVVSPRHGRGWWCLEEKDACSERRSDRTGRRVGATNRARDLDCRESEVLTDAAYVRLFSRRGFAGAVRVECGGRDAGAARSQTLSSKPSQNAALSRRTKPHRSAVGRWRTSGWHVWEPYFSITVYSYEFARRFLRTADPREEKDAEFFRLSRSRGAPPGRGVVKRRSRAPRSRLRGRTTRGAVFGANPGRGDSQAAASRSSSSRGGAG